MTTARLQERQTIIFRNEITSDLVPALGTSLLIEYSCLVYLQH